MFLLFPNVWRVMDKYEDKFVALRGITATFVKLGFIDSDLRDYALYWWSHGRHNLYHNYEME